MSPLDFVVLIGTVVGIAAYGVWRTRGRRVLSHYLKGNQTTGWLVIGISVMATQASAITFISTPGQGYQDGLGFVQNYFGAPLRADRHRRGLPADVPAAERLHGLRVPGPAVRRQDAAPGRGPVPGAARPRGRDHHLRAGDHPLHRAALAARRDHRAGRPGGHRLHGGRGQRGRERHPEVPARRDLLRDGGGVRGPADEAARGADALRHADPGRRLRQARRRRLLARREPPLYLLVGLAGGLLPGALLLRHRPVAGPALSLGGVVAREPARPDVQRRVQDPDAVLHPPAGSPGVRLLSVRAAAGLLQRGGLGSGDPPRHRRPTARPRATVQRGPRPEAAPDRPLARRAAFRRRRRGALGPRPGPRGAPRERGGPRRGEVGAASRPTRGRRPTTPTTSSSPSSCGTCRTG